MELEKTERPAEYHRLVMADLQLHDDPVQELELAGVRDLSGTSGLEQPCGCEHASAFLTQPRAAPHSMTTPREDNSDLSKRDCMPPFCHITISCRSLQRRLQDLQDLKRRDDLAGSSEPARLTHACLMAFLFSISSASTNSGCVLTFSDVFAT